MAAPETSRTRSAPLLNIAAHAAFVPTGIVTVILGPLLPALSLQWSMNYAQAGSLFTAQFVGATVGATLSGMVCSRLGFRFAINGGLFAMGLGVAMLMFVPRALGLFCIAGYGFGLGLTIPAANLIVAAANPERRSAALSLLNFSWSVGALACPFVVAAAAKVDAVRGLLVGIAGFLLVVLLGIAAMPANVFESTAPQSDKLLNTLPSNPGQRSFLVLSALFFLYVGTENAFGGWVASYARSLGTSSLSFAVITPSFFYAALMLGRWIAPFILEKIDEVTAARAGLFLAAAGMTGLVFSRTMPLVVASVSVAGFGMAAVFPITISLLSREFGPAAAKAGSIMFTLSNFGGASLPWLVGYFSHQANDLRIGLMVPVAATLLMYLLYHRQWASPSLEVRAA